MSGERAVLWVREDGSGAEWCGLRLSEERLMATGVQVGAAPVPYRLDYRLETWTGFATRELRLRAAGAGWSRLLTLRHSGPAGGRCPAKPTATRRSSPSAGLPRTSTARPTATSDSRR